MSEQETLFPIGTAPVGAPVDDFLTAARSLRGGVLGELLALAVPLEIERMADAEPQVRIDYAHARWERFQAYGGKAEKTGARLTGGAALAAGGKGGGEEFAILAQVLAVMAYQPGGVTAFGAHWCTDHAACVAAAAEAKERLL